MPGARFLLAAVAALAIAGCTGSPQNVQQASTQAHAPPLPPRTLYSTSPAYAQQAYEQNNAAPPSVQSSGARNLVALPAQNPAAQNSVLDPVGGPYVAATEAYASASNAAVTLAAHEPAYTLDAGDKLRVVVFGQDSITNSYIVDAGGKVNLPLIGAVTARGLTNQQLAAGIAARLKQGFVREPHVTVEIETYRPFFILGEVTTPGQYPYVVNLTAETAVAIAGGFAPRAYKKTVELTRKAGAQQLRTEVPIDYPVRPGDTIVVKERWF
jgi:polysaccharide export outer membrane protein